jgi:hypothetical protein
MNRNGSNSTEAISEAAVPESTGTLDGTVANNGGSLAPPVRRGGGPRTVQGKERSKRNATKHGLFSKAAFLEGESRAEFNVLLTGLHDHFDPVGFFENTLVNLLVSARWRQRRVLRTETAEIQAGIQFLEWDVKESQRTHAAGMSNLSLNGGLIRNIANPLALKRCLDLLDQLKAGIEQTGFDPKSDKELLTAIYGNFREPTLGNILFDDYMAHTKLEVVSADIRTQVKMPSSEACKMDFLERLSVERKRLEQYKEEREAIASARMQLESLRRGVLGSQRLDQLLKYSASLERTFDRTLSQLERAQAIRLGRPVLPAMKLDISSS